MLLKLALLTIFVMLIVPGLASADDAKSIVIIHGAWGGAHHWKATDQALTHQHHHNVRRVSLTGLGERSHLANANIGLQTHIRDVINVIEFDDLDSVVLIAHSYGGLVAQGVVESIPQCIAQVIYIDSHLLEDGECYLTHHKEERDKLTARAKDDGDGWSIPVDWDNPMRDTPHPLATLVQPIELTAAGDEVPAAYWLLADGKPPELDQRYRYYERAVQRGMTTKMFPWKHNPQRDRPDDLVRELVSAID